LHEGRLKIQRELAEAATLVRELQDFRVDYTAAGHLTFNARSGRHDDLVLALAIAVWKAHDGGFPNAGMFRVAEEAAARLTGRVMGPRYIVGVDLGQSRDPTAIAVVRRVDPEQVDQPFIPSAPARDYAPGSLEHAAAEAAAAAQRGPPEEC